MRIAEGANVVFGLTALRSIFLSKKYAQKSAASGAGPSRDGPAASIPAKNTAVGGDLDVAPHVDTQPLSVRYACKNMRNKGGPSASLRRRFGPEARGPDKRFQKTVSQSPVRAPNRRLGHSFRNRERQWKRLCSRRNTVPPK